MFIVAFVAFPCTFKAFTFLLFHTMADLVPSGSPDALPGTPMKDTPKRASKTPPESATKATPGSAKKKPSTSKSSLKTTPKASPKAKAKAKAKTKSKGKAAAVKSKASPKKRPSSRDENSTGEPEEKDEKDEKNQNPGPEKKVPKESMAKQAAGWAKALEDDAEKKGEDEDGDDEARDRQKAQKFTKLERAGALPKEVVEAMEAADKSANPRKAKTQLINRLFKKDGNKFVMVPNDPAFKRVQKFLDTKFGKEQANSHFDAFSNLCFMNPLVSPFKSNP